MFNKKNKVDQSKEKVDQLTSEPVNQSEEKVDRVNQVNQVNHGEEVEQLKKQVEENLAGWQRARADYDNLKKKPPKNAPNSLTSLTPTC